MKRVILIVLVGCAAIVFILAALVHFFLNSAVQTGIEKIGSAATQTEITVQSVNISILTGRAEINGLTVANPSGYGAEHAFTMNQIVVDLNPASLLGQLIQIEQVLVDGAQLTLEQRGAGSNIKEIMDNIQAFSASEAQQAEATGETPSKEVQITHLLITNTQLNVTSPLTGGQPFTVTMPNIELHNINQEGGLTQEEAVQRIVAAVVGAAANPANLLRNVHENIEGNVKGTLKDTIKGGKDALKSLNPFGK